jgi:hypothetical protein
MVKVDCILPLWQLIKLRLNDRVIIRDRRYIINQFKTDITKGEVEFELINDFRTLPFNTPQATPSNFRLSNNPLSVFVAVELGNASNVTIPPLPPLPTWYGYFSGVYTESFIFEVVLEENDTGLERTAIIPLIFNNNESGIFTINIIISQEP